MTARAARPLRARLALTSALTTALTGALTGAGLLLPALAAAQVTPVGIVTGTRFSGEAGAAAPVIGSTTTALGPPAATTTTVTLNARNTVVDWSSLNVLANATTTQTLNFVNNTGVATTANTVAVLNRVDPGSALNTGTTITGTINGLNSVTTGNAADVRGVEVWISNPNGIMIGNGGAINTNGLVLTTLPIGTIGDDGTAFTGTTAGVRLVSAAPTSDTSLVSGSGTYNIATSGGVLAVIAPVVQLGGAGSWDARDPAHTAGVGQAAFVAATDVTMQNAGSPLSVTINQGTTLATAGNNLDVSGTVRAGTVLMVLSAQQMVDTLLNVGADVATTATSGNGVVILAGNASTNTDAGVGFGADASGALLGGSGSVALGGPINTGTANLVLGARSVGGASGSISSTAGSMLTAGTLSARAGGDALLTAANQIGTVGALTAGGSVSLTNVGALTIGGGGVSAGSNATVATTAGTLNVAAPVTATAGAVSLTGATGIALGADVTGATSVGLNGAVTLGGAGSGITVTATGATGSVSFSGTIDGTTSLVVKGDGLKSFAGDIGGSAPLTSLASNANTGGAASSTSIAGNVTTSGNQNFTDALTLAGSGVRTLTSTANGSINLSTVDAAAPGSAGLATATAGATEFAGAVGHTQALSSLTATGPVQIDGGEVTTTATPSPATGLQSYGGDLKLSSNTVLSAGMGAITVAGTVYSAVADQYGLTIASAGSVTFNGVVGSTRLASLDTSGVTGATTLNIAPPGAGASVMTAGAQTYGAVVLQQNTALAAGGAVTFNGAIDGSAGTETLGIVATGTTTFKGVVGATHTLGSLSAGATDFAITPPAASGASVTTAGAQSYGATTLEQDTRLAAGSGNVSFANTVDSGASTSALSVTTTGLTSFGGAVGTTPLSALTIDGAGGRTSLGGNVTTIGAQSYNNTTIAGSHGAIQTLASIGGGTITFGGTLDADSYTAGAGAMLAVNTSGTTAFNGAVGGLNRFTSLTTDAPGATTINAAITADAPTFNDAVTITGARTINGGVTFNASVSGPGDLTLAGTLAKTANAGLGTGTGVTPLGSLAFNGSGAGSLAVIGDIATTGAQTYNYTLDLGDPSLMTARTTTLSGSMVAFNGGPASIVGYTGETLALEFGGATVLDGSVFTGFTGLRIGPSGGTVGATTTLSGIVSLPGDLQFNNAVTLAGNTIVASSGGGTVAFTNTVDGLGAGGQNLTVNTQGVTSFSGVVGGSRALGTLTTDAGGTTTLNAGVTAATQRYNDNVVLGSGTQVLNASIGLTFAGAVDGPGGLSLAGAGTKALDGAAGSGTALASLTSSGGALTIAGGSVRTIGAQTYTSGIVLAAATTLTGTGTGASFSAASITGNQDLTLDFAGAKSLDQANGAFSVANLLTRGAGTTTLYNTITTSGTQTYADAVLLGSAVTTVAAGANPIGFNGTLDAASAGNQALAVATTGTTTFGGIVGGVAPLAGLTTSSGPVAINTTAITTSGAQNYGGPVTLGADAVLTGSTIGFATGLNGNSAGADHSLTLATTGARTINGGFVGIRDLVAGGGGGTILSGTVQTSGRQSYNDAVTLAGNATLSSTASGVGGNADIGFGGTLVAATAGGAGLTVTTAGTTSFAGEVGGTAGGTSQLAALAVSGTGGVSIATDSIVTTGAQHYAGNVTLANAGPTTLTSTASGAIGFGHALDGTTAGMQRLAIDTAGTTSFGGAVGGAVSLATLGIDAGGTTAIDGGSVTTTGAQTYGDPVTLGANTVLTGSVVSFSAGGVNGHAAGVDHDLTLTTTGAKAIGNGFTGIRDLLANGGGATTLSGMVATSGTQTYSDAVTLGAATTLASTGTGPNGGGIAFASTIDGAQALTVTTPGTTSFAGVIGGTAAPTSLRVTGSGPIAIDTGIINAGVQSYAGAVTLGPGGTTTTLTGTSVAFGSTVDGARALIVNASGASSFGGLVGGAAPLISLTTDATGTTAINGGGVKTSGSQTYGDAVTVGATTTLAAGGAVSFSSTLDGAQAMTVNSAGTTTFAGIVGGSTAPTALNVVGSGPIAINTSAITAGAQSYAGPVTLGTGGTTTTLAGGSVSFGGTVDGARALQVNANGSTVFGGLVGGTTPLTALTTDAAGTTAINGGGVTTTGGQSYNDATTIGVRDAVLTSTGSGAIAFGGTLDGPQALAVTTQGSTTFAGAVGGATALASLTTDLGGTTAINGGSVRTNGAQLYGDRVVLGADTVLTSTGAGAITLGNTVDGARALRVDTAGLTSLGAAIGGTTPLASFQVYRGATALDGGTVTTTGFQSYAGAVALGADTRLTSTGSLPLIFMSTIDGAHVLSLVGGSAQLGGVVGGVTPLTGLAVRAGDFSANSGNRVGTFAAAVSNGVTYDDAGALTIGTVDGLSGISSGSAPSAISAGGLLTLATNIASGSLTLTGAGITQAAGTVANAGSGMVLIDGRGGAISLGGALTTTNATVNAVKLIDASTVLLGNVTTGAAGTITLGQSGAGLTGNVSQAAGTTINAGTLVGSTSGSVTLANAGNSIAMVGAIGANGVALRDSRSGLTVSGPVSAGTGNLSLTLDAGALTLAGNLSAPTGTVSLVSGGAINQTAGTITAATLTGNSVGATSLTATGNSVGRLGGFSNTGGGGIALTDSAALVVTGGVTASGDLSLAASGIDFTGQTLSATGAATLAGGSGAVAGATVTGGTNATVTGAGVNIGTAQANGGTLSLTATGSGQALTLGSGSASGAAALSSQGAVGVTGTLAAGSSVAVTATGAATLGQTNAGTTLAVTANGITAGATRAGSTLTFTSGGAIGLASGQAGGDASFDANGTASLGAVTAGAGAGITIRALDAQITGAQTAARVSFVNRSPGNVTLKLGDNTSSGGFQLSQAEVNFANAGTLTFDAGTGNVEIGTLAFNAAAGSSAVNVLATGRVDVLGAVSGSGAGRTFRFGGTAASADDKASVIEVVATPTGGGSLLVGSADLDLRGGRIGVGQAGGFLTPIGFGGATGLSASAVATAYVANATSALYNATYGGSAYATAATLVSAHSLTVRYGDYALFQNTGGPGINAGVVLGGSPSAPVANALAIVGSTGSSGNAFALFGSINGIGGTATALLGSQVITYSNINLVNTRVNGCLVGSGAGCLSSVVSQPSLNVFDASQLNIFRSADDFALPFDPVVGSNNEALFSGVDQLDVPITATDCAGHDDPSCRAADRPAAPKPDAATTNEGKK